jgi:hypothetical protein
MCCVVVAAFFGLACAIVDGDHSVTACLAADTSFIRDDPTRALPGDDLPRLDQAPPARSRLGSTSLLAAASGGLCLLI